MAFLQKLLIFALAPFIAFLSLRAYSPDLFQNLQDAVQPSEIPLLVSSVSHQSHIEKVAPIAIALAELGHPVTFISGNVFADYVTNLHPNITFYPLQGLEDKLTEEDLAYWMSLPSGVEREIWITKKVLIEGAPDTHATYQAYFQEFRDKYGDEKPLISLFDQTMAGHLTTLLGVPGIVPDASIGISLTPLLVHSNDTFPARDGKKPHQGPNAREVHQRAYDEPQDPYEWEISKAWWAKLKEMGSTRESFPQLLDGFNRVPDHLLTIGIPEFEFPRTDLGLSVRYIGALNKGSKTSGSADLPSWWDDVRKAKDSGKKVIAVSQGTVETDPSEIILPALEALKDRSDVLVVATFYTSEPEEVEGLVVPENARVAKYIPHDDLLPFVDVMVTNGGMGGVQKCLMAGVPMVISGLGQDKALVAAIADFTGVAINLEARAPGAEKIGTAVGEILGNGTYRANALKMSKAFDKYDMQQEVGKLVRDIVRDWQKNKSSSKEL